MPDQGARKSIRSFFANAFKLLLHNADNVRDLLVLARPTVVELIDFRGLEVIGSTFVQRDYRNLESDVVLKVPLRLKGRKGRQILLYILIEHQSEPDELMPLRVLEYVVALYKWQSREWETAHGSLRGVRLQPVLPLVFYTGTRTWTDIGILSDAIEEGERFKDVMPLLRPLFLNLRETAPDRLETEGGFFGQVLRLVRERRAKSRELRGVLRAALRRLAEMPPEQQQRWKDLLTFIGAFLYHERAESELPGLFELIDASVQTDEHKREVKIMRRTMAEKLEEDGAVRFGRQTLLALLGKRFGEVPSDIAATVEMTVDLERLAAWLDRFATATTLEEIGILPASEGRRRGKR